MSSLSGAGTMGLSMGEVHRPVAAPALALWAARFCSRVPVLVVATLVRKGATTYEASEFCPVLSVAASGRNRE